MVTCFVGALVILGLFPVLNFHLCLVRKAVSSTVCFCWVLGSPEVPQAKFRTWLPRLQIHKEVSFQLTIILGFELFQSSYFEGKALDLFFEKILIFYFSSRLRVFQTKS